ncbi:hypothetical protein ACQCRJ_26865, partial [Ralstonia pseudosolanacearum]|uniref:hypothetical protein n=1 Tax=Ralstonia pseudosolanacearum TaxID=1310165 RepID=UPI003CF701AB
ETSFLIFPPEIPKMHIFVVMNARIGCGYYTHGRGIDQNMQRMIADFVPSGIFRYLPSGKLSLSDSSQIRH